MEYKKNDIVRLCNKYFAEICAKLLYKENLFYIDDKSANGKFVSLREVDFLVPSSESVSCKDRCR